MSESRELASDCWEVERQAGGQVLRPLYVVVLRHKNNRSKSVVKASSSDFTSVNRYAEQLSDDLFTLSNSEFVEKYRLGHIA